MTYAGTRRIIDVDSHDGNMAGLMDLASASWQRKLRTNK